MNETELGEPWDVSYQPDLKDDVILIDAECGPVYLTRSDLTDMLEVLDA